MEIAGRTALVTGAARGIGAASARMLAESGASVVALADRNERDLATTAEHVERAGARVVALGADLSDPVAVIDLLDQADARTGGLDIVHNNAGIMAGPPDFPDTPAERMVAVIQVNLVAAMVGTRQAVALMRARGQGGVVVNTASIAAFQPMPADPAYAASKAGLVSFTQSCKPLNDAFGIRVVAVCPGMTDTAIVPREAPWLKDALASLKMLEPEDIARAVRALIEDDTKAGEYLVVDNEPAAAG